LAGSGFAAGAAFAAKTVCGTANAGFSAAAGAAAFSAVAPSVFACAAKADTATSCSCFRCATLATKLAKTLVPYSAVTARRISAWYACCWFGKRHFCVSGYAYPNVAVSLICADVQNLVPDLSQKGASGVSLVWDSPPVALNVEYGAGRGDMLALGLRSCHMAHSRSTLLARGKT